AGRNSTTRSQTMRSAARFRLAAFLILATSSPAPLFAQATAVADPSPAVETSRRVLTLDDYGEWKRITSTDLSPDGQWMSFVYDRNEGEDTLYVKELDGEAVHAVPLGASPAFSDDSRWVAYYINPPESRGGRQGAREGGQGGGEQGGNA